MRFSLRKVVKYSTFLLIFLTFNVLISYNVNLWSFERNGKQQPVLKSLGQPENFDNNGGERSLKTFEKSESEEIKAGFDILSDFRVLRSAKSVVLYDEKPRQYVDDVIVPDNHSNRPRSSTSVQQVGRRNDSSNGEENFNGFRHEQSNQGDEMTKLEDVFISVKTTLKYHQSRLKLLLKTWYRLALQQTYFFTDGDDAKLQTYLGNHYINTNCSTDHSRRALSCKMAYEFDAYMASRKRWFCHVDDDVYLNVPQLVEVLRKYNHKEDWYLGKPSLRHPLEVPNREVPGMKLTFWFATGGAGFCISRSLVLKMAPHASGGRFMSTAERIRLPDDCTIGYIVDYLLRQRLTIIPEFHSHLENLWLIKQNLLKKQITFSFSDYSKRTNVVNVPGFSTKEDPTRFMSLHCYLFPKFHECLSLKKSQPAV